LYRSTKPHPRGGRRGGSVIGGRKYEIGKEKYWNKEEEKGIIMYEVKIFSYGGKGIEGK
jgi:hypothetical protein